MAAGDVPGQARGDSATEARRGLTDRSRFTHRGEGVRGVLTKEQLIQEDIKRLHGMGYAQELFRAMGGFSNFAISFTIISVLSGCLTLFYSGIGSAGPASASLGWPLVSLFTLLVALS